MSTPAQRILVVSDEMEVGGSQRQIVHLLLGAQRMGRAPALLYFRKPSFLLDALREAGIDVRRIDKRGAIDPGFLWALVKHLRRGRYDVVHCFSITAEIWVRLALLLVPHTRLVSSIRGLGLDGPAWHWRAKRWIIRGSAAVISNSRAAVALVAERCRLAMERCVVVANGVQLPQPLPAAERAALRTELGIDASRPLLLFIGRLVLAKNVSLLLRALAALPTAQRPQAWLAGDGPERAALQAEAERLQVNTSLRFLGERSDTARLLQAADLLVLPSREEGLSNVILEAMGSGVAVIATAVGGSPELIEDGVSGRLVGDDDSAALAAAIDELCADPARRQRLAARARAQAEARFSIDGMVAATLDTYDRCLSAAGTR